MNFFDYFQIAGVAIVLFIFAGRASYLRFSRNINPIVIGGGKKGLLLAIEVAAVISLVAWIIEVVLSDLLKVYGQPYQSYCARTGRYLYW